MGLLDKVKNLTAGKDQKLKGAVDKAAGFVDEKTKGKYSDKLHKGSDSAHRLIERLEGDDETRGPDDTTSGHPDDPTRN